MYLDSIFWFLSWPVIIIVSYQISKMLIKKYESEKVEKADNSASE